MDWHSVRKWKRPIPSILRARPRANEEEHGAHDAPKRKTGDMDQVGFRAANFSQKTAKRTRVSRAKVRATKGRGKRDATKWLSGSAKVSIVTIRDRSLEVILSDVYIRNEGRGSKDNE